jgi:UDP-N-acetylmuramoyl-L-alanyl-D-glutamate--2,6-diaminopimelate ligase
MELRRWPTLKPKLSPTRLKGLELEIGERNVWFKLIGDFNAYNLLAVYGAACLLNEDPELVLMRLSALSGASGRFELVIPGSKVYCYCGLCSHSGCIVKMFWRR